MQRLLCQFLFRNKCICKLRQASSSSLEKTYCLRNFWLASFLLFSLFASPAQLYAEEKVSVTIQGIDGRLYENVLAGLKIVKRKEDSSLEELEIRKLHKAAEAEIREALEPFGYYSPQITARLEFIDGRWHAYYTVLRGLPVIVKELNIRLAEGDEIQSYFQEIVGGFPLQQGDPLDHSLYKKGKKKILQGLFALGYIDSSYVRSEIAIKREEKSAAVTLVVKPGPQYLFGDVIFDQNLLDEALLEKFINFEFGEPYSVVKLLRLQQILYRTNYFSEVVVKGETGKASGLFVPVVVKLSRPEFYNKYSFGVGYATDDGVRGKIGWENRLFNSYGHRVSAEVKAAEREGSWKVVYGIPVNDPRFDTTYFGGSYNDETWETTDSRLFSGGVSYEHSGKRFQYGGGLEFRDEKYNVGTTSGETLLTVPFVRWSVAYGDDLINTKHGIFFSVIVKGAAENVLSDTSFLQALVSGKLITTPFDGLRLLGRASIGGTLVESIDDLPPSLRFYAGGDQSVRGYGYKELGSEDERGTVVGGKYLLFGSIEAEKALYQNWSGALFVDVGKGINSFSEDLAKGIGVGVRYRLPFGQIRLDVASAVSQDDNPLRVHITVGGDL